MNNRLESNTQKKKIPLGLSSYKEIITDGYYYVDKTRYIEVLENLNTKYPILLRPRRFGKTLFADTLRCYYDINEKDNFGLLFGHTYIGKHKTGLANTFYMLHFNFSGLDTGDADRLESTFGNNIKSKIKTFLRKYSFDFTLDEGTPFISYLDDFLNKLESYIPEKKLFIIIDEYDHFANSLLSSTSDFQAATSKDGIIRSFYEVLKKHTQSTLSRIFITGVTSLTLDSLTSGFNISENVSDYASLNEALGFTYDEVKDLVSYMGITNIADTLEILKESYDGYLFSPQAAERIYNSNMILYFMNSFQNRGTSPKQLADPNITSDYQKLSSMFDLYTDTVERELLLQRLMVNEPVTGNLVSSFNLIEQFSSDHFISLLYYLGLLTLDKEITGDTFQFKTPNNVIMEVYYDYYYNYLTKTSTITTSIINDAIRALEIDSDIVPLIDVIEQIIDDFTNINNRYMIHFRENSLQTILFLLLRNSKMYNTHMEYAAENSYVDILHRSIQNDRSFAIELKYISNAKYKTDKAILQNTIDEVTTQIHSSKNLIKSTKGIAIVFVGKKCMYHKIL